MTSRHKWNPTPTRIHPQDSPDGNERTERTCVLCGTVRITVRVPVGYPLTEWRHPGGWTYRTQSTPGCNGGEVPFR